MECPSMLLLEAFLIGQELSAFKKWPNDCAVKLGCAFPHEKGTDQAPSVDLILNEPWPYWTNLSIRIFHPRMLAGGLPERLLPLRLCILPNYGIWEVKSKYYCQRQWEQIHIRIEINIFSVYTATLIQMILHWLPFSSIIYGFAWIFLWDYLPLKIVSGCNIISLRNFWKCLGWELKKKILRKMRSSRKLNRCFPKRRPEADLPAVICGLVISWD